MELVTERDMEDARGLGERSGLNMMDDWDEFIHDVAQTIANGRRTAPNDSICICPRCGRQHRALGFDRPPSGLVSEDGFVRTVEWPDPTPDMLASPQFEAVWQCIKSWDINVPAAYSGYMGATGNHVRAILDALVDKEREGKS